MFSKTFRFLTELNQTVSYSNHNYFGSGNINLYQKDLRTGRTNFTHAYSRRDPVNLMKYINKYTENWYSANSVSNESRAKAKVLGFNMLFCDIDSMGIAGVSPEASYQRVIDCVNDDKILKPSAVIMSGHGLHLIYLFKSQVPNHNAKIKNYWQKTEAANLKRISQYVKGVDWKVKDPNRILRMPGSNNTKDYARTGRKDCLIPVQVLDVNRTKYDFWTLCKEMVEQPEHKARVARYKAWKQNSEYKNSLRTHKHLKLKVRKLDKTSLNLAHRIKSVIKLVEVRHGHMDHYRNTVLHIIGSGWLYVNRGAKHVSADTQKEIKDYTWNLVQRVNGMFEVPKRKAVMERFKSRIMSSNFDINVKHNDFGKYCYSKKGMIEVLHIKPSEQWDLKYLRTPKVEKEHLAYVRKMNRYNEKAAHDYAWNEERLQRLQKRVKLVHKLLKDRKQGYTYRQIASACGCSVSHIYNLIRQYRYLAKRYGTHAYQHAIKTLGNLILNKVSVDTLPNIMDLTLAEMNRIRGSA